MAQGGASRFARVSAKPHRAAKLDDKLAFFTQLSTLLGAGTPLLSALRIAAEQCESEKLGVVLKQLANRVASGTTLYAGMVEHPKMFENQWAHIVRIGEASGQLAFTVKELTAFIQSAKAMQAKVVSAMMYPAILACVAVGSVFVMLWKVVPTFAEFFGDSDMKLPAMTRGVIALSNFVAARGLTLVGGTVVGVFFLRRYLRTPRGKRQIDTLSFMVPIFGELVVQAAMEKFASTLKMLLRSGTPFLEAIRSTQEQFSNNTQYYAALGTVWDSVSRGRPLATALHETGLFTPMLVNMVRIGEETGQLVEVLEHTAGYYRGKVDTLITRVTGVLEPLIVVFMGVVIAVLLSSIYLPMFQMAGGGGGG